MRLCRTFVNGVMDADDSSNVTSGRQPIGVPQPLPQPLSGAKSV
jgi:hypothetical protein